ncbi:hypothetical protein B0T20DRAFT_232589 [Sordaria brevicollis]|uniref:MARVEL domain-containing protein n=1 Tax=Sordaria brevicollis TaxID=83679 RepID=A0AAE0PDH6_SORBR|nr:hypothetical protein B0T20DRAFT_232589 [Sordaria brevicollis]
MPYCKYSSDRAPGWEHIPLYPKGFIAIRIVQLVFSILISGFSAFTTHVYFFDAGIFVLAVGIATLITSTYHLVARYSNLRAYNYWAILVLDISLVVFWLACFGAITAKIFSIDAMARYENTSADWSNNVPEYDPSGSTAGDDNYDYETFAAFSYGGKKTLLTGRRLSRSDYWAGGSYIFGRDVDYWTDWSMVTDCVIVLSALGGVQITLHITSLVIHSVYLHRHRAAGLHSRPVNSFPSSSESGTLLVPPSAGINNNNKNRPFQLDSTPVPIPHIQVQNHNNHNQIQQPSSVPSPAPSYTPASGNQPYLKQQPYLCPEQPQDQQGKYQAYQPFPAHGHISPQTTGGTTYTQFQRSLAVSAVPVSTHHVASHQGLPAGVYQLP